VTVGQGRGAGSATKPEVAEPRVLAQFPHTGGDAGNPTQMAMMMDAGESKSPARALRRLAGAAVAAVLLRRNFSPSKWYALRLSLFLVIRGDGTWD
jgi:hypothetical protein